MRCESGEGRLRICVLRAGRGADGIVPFPIDGIDPGGAWLTRLGSPGILKVAQRFPKLLLLGAVWSIGRSALHVQRAVATDPGP